MDNRTQPETLEYARPEAKAFGAVLVRYVQVWIVYVILSLIAGTTITFIGVTVPLSDKWESFYVTIPISLGTALVTLLLISLRRKMEWLVWPAVVACGFSSLCCVVIGRIIENSAVP